MFRIMFRVMLEKHSLEKQLLEYWRIFGKVDKIIVTGTVGNIIGRFFTNYWKNSKKNGQMKNLEK